MAIATYSDLQTAIADHLHRSDLTSAIPTFIALAEENLSADISARAMDSTATLTLTAGTATIAAPTDLVEMRRMAITDSYTTVLKYLSPDQIARDYSLQQVARPLAFTVIGPNIEFAPTPDFSYTVKLVYKQRIPALSNSNTTNWLLTSNPSCYLYGALVAAQPYLGKDGRLALYSQLYQEAVDNVNRIDWYSGSTMRVKAG